MRTCAWAGDIDEIADLMPEVDVHTEGTARARQPAESQRLTKIERCTEHNVSSRADAQRFDVGTSGQDPLAAAVDPHVDAQTERRRIYFAGQYRAICQIHRRFTRRVSEDIPKQAGMTGIEVNCRR